LISFALPNKVVNTIEVSIREEYFRQARINVDGLRMSEALTVENDVLEQFFEVEHVFDSTRPTAKLLIP
jgi:hypothetical protein